VATLFLPAVSAGGLIVRQLSSYLHIDPKLGLAMVMAEFIGYAIVFLALRVLFARYGKPLFQSLAWVAQPFRPLHLAVLGFVLYFAVVLLGGLLGLPNRETLR
jgi:hypothetical protein